MTDPQPDADPFVTLARRQVLAKQIDSAIWTLCVRREAIVANLIANAAIDVLRTLCNAAGVDTFKGRLEAHIRPEELENFRRHDREAYNHSKHADRDPAADIRFNPEQADFNVLAATVDFGSLFRRNTASMILFRSFQLAKRPHTLVEGEFRQMHETFAANIALDFGHLTMDEACREMLLAIDDRPALVANWPNLEA